jgi:hypothetical protein
MDQLGPGAPEALRQRGDARDAEAQLAIDRDGETEGAQLVARVEGGLAGLARPDQLDVVAARAQEADRALDGERDAVQLGRIGLGDVGDPHRAAKGSVHRLILAIDMPLRSRTRPQARRSWRIPHDGAKTAAVA